VSGVSAFVILPGVLDSGSRAVSMLSVVYPGVITSKQTSKQVAIYRIFYFCSRSAGFSLPAFDPVRSHAEKSCRLLDSCSCFVLNVGFLTGKGAVGRQRGVT
jgi:hypothetical protein